MTALADRNIKIIPAIVAGGKAGDGNMANAMLAMLRENMMKGKIGEQKE
jgi:hypothetical protein